MIHHHHHHHHNNNAIIINNNTIINNKKYTQPHMNGHSALAVAASWLCEGAMHSVATSALQQVTSIIPTCVCVCACVCVCGWVRGRACQGRGHILCEGTTSAWTGGSEVGWGSKLAEWSGMGAGRRGCWTLIIKFLTITLFAPAGFVNGVS